MASKADTDSKSSSEAAAPWRKALTRSIASFGTWFVTEHPKLIFQQQRGQSPFPLLTTLSVYRKTPLRQHLRGATSSAAQRGSSAFIMFYGQAYISQAIYGQAQAPSWWSAGLAGFLGGGISSLVHTVFEPIKIRHQPMSLAVYKASLWPMMWRHALFDGTFFATSSCLQEYSYATQFGIAALAASTANLTHDLWKTQFIQALPNRIKWMVVVKGLNFSSFQQQLVMKASDLGFNWWATGLLYAYLFAN